LRDSRHPHPRAGLSGLTLKWAFKCEGLIYTIIKTAGVGDTRLSMVGVAGCAWSTHA